MVLQAEPQARQATTAAGAPSIERHFTAPGDDPFAAVEWELRTAVIADESGNAFFEQKDVEIPKAWS